MIDTSRWFVYEIDYLDGYGYNGCCAIKAPNKTNALEYFHRTMTTRKLLKIKRRTKAIGAA